MSTIVQTLTNGIQEISAILPLLGTEQCEEQVGLALNNGYLYAAITPVSLFGSLGIVKAGFNTLLASIAIPKYHILGAKMLDYMGFHPKGGVSESIAIDENHRGRFLVESQLEKLLEDEHIDVIEALRLEAAPGCFRWNVFMALLTLIIPASLGITPYLFLIVRSSKSGTSFVGFPVWVFPTIRISCNVLCTVAIQFIIQIRILNIVKMRLIFNIVDRYARKIGYPLSKYIHPWDKVISSEMCISALQLQHMFWNSNGVAIHRNSGDPEMGPTSPDLPSREKRDNIDKLLQEQITRHFPRSSLFTKIQNSQWINILLFFTLLMSIPGSVLGYIGCFNVVAVDDQQSIAPILWLGLEGILCFVRILVWAMNPVWDDCGGIAFCMQLIQKCPLVTCNLYGEELERLGVAPVMREGEFLGEVTSYSGPMASFDHKDTTFYYIFTRRRQEEVEKSLYIIVSNYKEQTSRIFTRRNTGNDDGSDFRVYVSTLVPDSKSHAAGVSVHFQTTNDSTKLQEVDEASDPDFMSKFKRHYREILTRMEPKTPESRIEKRLKFRRGWTIGKMEEWGNTREIVYTENPNFITHAVGQMLRKLTLKPKEDHIHLGLVSKSTDEDEEYIAFGQKERRAGRFLDEIEKWIQIYLEALNKDFQLSLYMKTKMASSKSGFSRKMLLILEAYEENEVRFLLNEARKQMEMLLLRQVPPWRKFLAGEQAAMTRNVLTSFNFDDKFKIWGERLHSRLSTEWKLSQKRLSESRLSRAVQRLEEQSKLARERMARQRYDQAIAISVLDKWRGRSELELSGEDELREDVGSITDKDLERERADYQASVSKRFQMRRSIFYNELEAEKAHSKDEERLFFRRLFKRIKNIYIDKAQLLFYMLEGQLEHINTRTEVLRGVTRDSEYYRMSPEQEQEKLRFIQDHRFLKITRMAFEIFGGSANICKILRQTRGICAVDFVDASPDVSDSDFKEIKNTVQQIETITGVFMSQYSDHHEISDVVKTNVDKISRTDDVCFYEHLRIADHYRAGEPYLYFDVPGSSTCTVKFRVRAEEDHILTLRHCFKGWWGENGMIDIALNGANLNQTWGLTPTFDDFGDEDIALPRAMLNLYPELNELEIRLKGGAYHLSDVFLPVLSVNDSL